MNLQHENERFFRRLNRSSSTSDINKNGLSAVVFKGSFKNSVGERKTETRKTQMSSRNGTHF